jgi:hypothetical protein
MYNESTIFTTKYYAPFGRYHVLSIYDFQGDEYTGLFISPWNILKIYNK